MAMRIRFKRLDARAVAPVKAHPSDAGFDLTATSFRVERGVYVYGTGIAVEIPDGYVGLLFPRSSIAKKSLALTNCVGVVDSGYRGEIMAKFRPADRFAGGAKSHEPYEPVYEIGDRILQLIIMPYPQVEFEEADELSESDRGEGGFGSTGK